MRLSCLPVSFFGDILAGRMTIDEWARLGVQAGLDAVDLSILFLPERTRAQAVAIRRAIEQEGLRVAMLTTYPDFTHPQSAQRRREIDQALDSLALAADLGADLLRVTAGQAHPETSRAQGVGWAAEGLARVAEAARGGAVRPVYENHAKPGAWTYTDFSQPPQLFLAIVRKTSDVGLGVNFDTGNATAFADDPLDLLEQVIDRVVSVHAADTGAKGELRPVLLGTGLAPIEAIFRRLDRAGWDGWVCIEEASGQGPSGVEAAARFVRRAWQAAAGMQEPG